jgi:hypothetical protein
LYPHKGYRNFDKDLVVNFKNVDSISELVEDGCAGNIKLVVSSIFYKAEFYVTAGKLSSQHKTK